MTDHIPIDDMRALLKRWEDAIDADRVALTDHLSNQIAREVPALLRRLDCAGDVEARERQAESERREYLRAKGRMEREVERLREIAEPWSQNCCPSAEPCDHALARALLSARAEVARLKKDAEFLHKRRGELVIERDEARAESIAVKGTIDEAGIGTLPCPVVGKILRPDGREEDLVVHPDTMTGLWSALRQKVRQMVPWAQRCIEGEGAQRLRAETAEAEVERLRFENEQLASHNEEQTRLHSIITTLEAEAARLREALAERCDCTFTLVDREPMDVCEYHAALAPEPAREEECAYCGCLPCRPSCDCDDCALAPDPEPAPKCDPDLARRLGESYGREIEREEDDRE